MVVLVCTYFRLCSLTRGCMNMLALQRIAYEVIGNVLHFSSSQMVRCPALDDTSALVVIESGVIISGTPVASTRAVTVPVSNPLLLSV